MAIQNPIGGRQGGVASALGINTPTVIKASAGTFWNINVNTFGTNPGYLCDSATIAGASPANAILVIPQISALPYGNSGDIPGAGPFPFINGLVFLPGSADLNVSVSYQ